jgi:hypothetical protein
MGIELGAVGMYGGLGGNFDTHPDYRHDLFYQVQNAVRGIGDIRSGKANDFLTRAYEQNWWHTEDKLAELQDKFLERAYEQNWWHTEDKLAELQDKFLEDDMVNNTPGRGQKNYRRMEYDITKNPNGKGAEEDRKAAEEKEVLTKDKLLDLLDNVRYSICSTASAWGNEPIQQKDYQDQIKLR